MEKTLDRINDPIFDSPIISTNKAYEKLVLAVLRKKKIKKFKIMLEPLKKKHSCSDYKFNTNK